MKTIAIIDYGMGNLNSVSKALAVAAKRAHLDAKIIITESPRQLDKADAVILPGVGAFGEAMKNLKKIGMTNKILEILKTNKPFLGICLGFQLLFEKSNEKGKHKGLGFFKGEAKKFDLPKNYKIPHMGWNQVKTKGCKLFNGIKKNSYFYFVHSYYVEPKEKKIGKMISNYGKDFCAGIHYKNLYAMQFHPEKSQSLGLKLLENFCREI